MNEKVSIIMPAYRCKNTLPRAVTSVINQTYPNWELLIINDGCPDNSYQSVQDFSESDSRISVLHHQKNQGVAAARNSGIDKASGKYIAFLDADDMWMPEKLALQVELLNTGVAIAFCDYYRDCNNNRFIVSAPSKVSYKNLLYSNFICNSTGIYNAEKLGKVYQENHGHEDYIMWLSLLQKTDYAASINQALATYFVSEKTVSSNKVKAALWQWDIYRKILKFNRFKSLYYFLFYVFFAIKKRINISS